MEDLQAAHRKQLRDLQSKITQKKKSASKKTRKGVNDECDELERNLKERQARELDAFYSTNSANEQYNDQSDVASKIFNSHESSERSDGVDLAITTTERLSITANSSIDSPHEGQAQRRRPNRQKARLARRAAEQNAIAASAAEEAAQLPNLREREREIMVKEFQKYKLKEHEIRPDGHCLYSAVADQIEQLDLEIQPGQASESTTEESIASKNVPGYRLVRQTASNYISQHAEDFVPFLDESLDDYLHKVRDTAEWGGQVELMALANAYGIIINVIQGDGRLEKIEPGQSTDCKSIWLAYYRHGFGLGEHYNSLRSL